MLKFTFLLATLFALTACHKNLTVHHPDRVVDPLTNKTLQKEVKFSDVQNDPTNTRIYELDNGLKVYLSVNKKEPRVTSYIAVKTGSKNDPAHATGLAHYLEHMLFKGTTRFGTMDYETEKVYLDKIEALYEQHRATKDPELRKRIYAEIDSVSNIASQYSIANEYDKMMSNIGAQGTNAYTSTDETVYINDLPSNQMENWIKVEAERFLNPVMRIFHTELEAVYEEKNRSLDSDGSQVWEKLFEALYPNHTYGTQTTIGTVEHLKNPSIKEIKEYFYKYYVPNNVAICLAGDLDPDKTIQWIQEYFGSWEAKEVTPSKQKAGELKEVKTVEVFGPEREQMRIAYRFDGAKSLQLDTLALVDMILSNSMAGLLDLNLNQAQKVMSSGSFVYEATDYSSHILYGLPKEGQTLEQVRDLVIAEIDKIKNGNFDNDLLPAIINDFKRSEMKSMESNRARVSNYVSSFIHGIPMEQLIEQINRLEKIDKEDVMSFTQRHYKDNYVVVFKRKGERPKVQVEKPQITPVEVNRGAQSPFLKEVVESKPSKIEPVFIDYKQVIDFDTLKNQLPFAYIKNETNGLFQFNMRWEMGSRNESKLDLLDAYFDYISTDKFSNEELQKRFYQLGCSYRFSVKEKSLTVSLSGLTENFERALVLLQDILENAKPDQQVFDNVVADILKNRKEALSNKNIILRSALTSYAMYGEHSPFTDIASEEELKSMKAEDLLVLLKNLKNFKHELMFYGNLEKNRAKEITELHHRVPRGFVEIPTAKKYEYQAMDTRKVYWVDFPMEQAEFMFIAKGGKTDVELKPMIDLYNQYFGGGMSGIVFQDIRESKALAYSAYSIYRMGSDSAGHHFNIAYIGTQSDKLREALKGMNDLLTDMPQEEKNLETAKSAMESEIRTERILDVAAYYNYLSWRKFGVDTDIRKDVFKSIPEMSMEKLVEFQQNYVANQTYSIIVIGDKDKLDKEALAEYGELVELSLEEVFGY